MLEYMQAAAVQKCIVNVLQRDVSSPTAFVASLKGIQAMFLYHIAYITSPDSGTTIALDLLYMCHMSTPTHFSRP